MFQHSSLSKLDGTEQRELLWALLGKAADALFLVGEDGEVRLANPSAVALLGGSNRSLDGRDVRSLIADEFADEVWTEVQRILAKSDADPVAREFEVDVLRSDDSVFPARLTLDIVRVGGITPAGGTQWASISIVDLSEQKQALSAMAEADERYRCLVESAPVCIHEIDTQGQMISMNPAGLCMLSRDLEQVVGLDYMSFVDDDSREEIQGLLERALSGETSFFQFRANTNDGTHVFSSCFVPILDEFGRVQRLMGITEDITARLRAEDDRARVEQQMLHAQKLESLGVLAGGIAHDFNNLLMGVLGNASLALDDAKTPSVRVCLEGIESTAVRAAELCKQLLAYAGKGKFHVRTIDLTGVIEEMGHMLAMTIAPKTELRYELEADLPPVDADAAQLRQVIMNLILNASDAIDGHVGTITVRAGRVDVDEETLRSMVLGGKLKAGAFVSLEVTDTGLGMDSHAQAHMFDPFFTTKTNGRGLGLAATLGIIRAHSGAIDCTSEVGRGTTLRILLPTSAEEAEPDADPSNDDSGAEDWRGDGLALVIDDERTARSVATRMLRRAGFKVLAASDGEVGLDLMRQRSSELRLVLLDIVAPDLEGADILRRIRSLDRKTPVIVSSDYDEQEATRVFSSEGLAGFIQKPYRSRSLLAKVREVLDAQGHTTGS